MLKRRRYGGVIMAATSKPINKPLIIKKGKSSQFIKELNKNQVSKEFLKECKKAGKLFENSK